MADTLAGSSSPHSPFRPADPAMAGTWQTVEQAAVALGLSVRTVNRHISAQKLNSRLMDGRREVFVPGNDPSHAEDQPNNIDTQPSSPKLAQPDLTGTPTSQSSPQLPPQDADAANVKAGSFLDLDTALAMADRKADRQVEMAITVYQSLTRSIESQAHKAKRTATIAWCVVAVLTVGVTVTLVWTSTRLTKAQSDFEHVKEQADLDAQRLKQEVDEADKRADSKERDLASIQQRLSEAQQQAARAEGRAAVFEEMQSRQPSSQPTSRPSLIDKLTNAFGTGH